MCKGNKSNKMFIISKICFIAIKVIYHKLLILLIKISLLTKNSIYANWLECLDDEKYRKLIKGYFSLEIGKNRKFFI